MRKHTTDFVKRGWCSQAVLTQISTCRMNYELPWRIKRIKFLVWLWKPSKWLFEPSTKKISIPKKTQALNSFSGTCSGHLYQAFFLNLSLSLIRNWRFMKLKFALTFASFIKWSVNFRDLNFHYFGTKFSILLWHPGRLWMRSILSGWRSMKLWRTLKVTRYLRLTPLITFRERSTR